MGLRWAKKAANIDAISNLVSTRSLLSCQPRGTLCVGAGGEHGGLQVADVCDDAGVDNTKNTRYDVRVLCM